jgi:protein-disulfide isomerase
VPLGPGGLRLGLGQAPLQITEFADFECPFCSVAAGEIKELREKYPGAVSITYRHLLIPGHSHSAGAALAAECANEQGAFESFYDLMFANYDNLGRKSWMDWAKEARVQDLGAFADCLKSPRRLANIDADTALAPRLGLRSTPSWIIGDSVYAGAPSMEQLESWVRAASAPRTRERAKNE